MITINDIKSDLKDIRYYSSRKDLFDVAKNYVGKNEIFDKINLYNEIICSAPPRLYDIYVSLYLNNNTQESLADKLGFSVDYIFKLNRKLVKYLQNVLSEKQENK